MKLSDLKPNPVDFELCGLPLTFRPFTIADDIKAAELCGGRKQMVDAFEKFDFEKLSLIAWYQLDLKSQRAILERTEAVYVDPETGAETKAQTTPLKRFQALFVGLADQISLITNLAKCKGLNIPDLDDEEALGKWVSQLSEALGLTGQ
jgi:hypothetical protein